MNSTAGFQMALKMSKEGTFGNTNTNKNEEIDDEEEQIRKAIELSE